MFLLIITIYIKREESKVLGKIYPHVTIDGINFGRKTKGDVELYFNKKDQELKKISLFVRYKDQEATFSAGLLNLHYDSKTAAEQAFSIGRGGPLLSKLYQRVSTILGFDDFSFDSFVTYDITPVSDYLTNLETRYNKEPQNALFQFENGRVTAFKIEKDGLKIKSEQTFLEAGDSLKHVKDIQNNAIVIVVNDEILKPQITLASTNNLGIEEKIGEGTSNYSGSIPGRIHNVLLGTSRINGTLIPKGTIFSFNETVGDISAETGYQQAYIIKNGQTVLGDGGGICQVSTTLFRAALDAGLPINARTAHAYRVHYYENDRKPGFDATVFAPSVDLKFKNDTPSPILIQTEVDKAKNLLTYILYGKRDGRISIVSDATLWDIQSAPEPKYQDDPTLKVGTTKQVDFSAPGTKSKFHYRVERGGEVLEDRDFLSVYRPWQAVFLVGTMQ